MINLTRYSGIELREHNYYVKMNNKTILCCFHDMRVSREKRKPTCGRSDENENSYIAQVTQSSARTTITIRCSHPNRGHETHF
jgi:hypothetical protein